MPWEPSPSAGVWRKRLHLVGPPECGQVTSIVKFGEGASFPAHDHPDGEEILVLEGTFSDHEGDWPAGVYLLNPEGFRHAPFSERGCVLFVKLRQYPGREHVARETTAMAWESGPLPGIQVKTLHRDAQTATRLERWRAGTALGSRSYEGGAELLVLDGALHDESSTCDAGSWLRLPPGAHHAPKAPDGCILYVKTGGVVALRSDGGP
ncbi:MAG: anti-sigma factor [Gammaproteobacteria bacterium]|nr:anti-sigma factor [Gammaproteobacteria bacterium]NIR85391.1 anti-sigma factor [Gammaproteobacteria bacterium]NIR88909.1 anti-sigma factor [Gammaproteobacteria bacterium]NIU06517.1 anti-sigma factor [Gammaproteobacteria bacterium]NIV53410.1 anti-sigma factor [Gammaproteobacteria bacterium]